jgi:lipoate---protein ligase
MSVNDAGDGSRGLWIVVSPPRSVMENLAMDEENTRAAAESRQWTLRLWWGGASTVVTGRSEKSEVVADLTVCRRLGVEVVQRSSGGGTVLQTPDVLNYSLTGPAPHLLDVRAIFSIGARLLIGALATWGIQAEPRGISDVAVGEMKISGNAMAKRWGGLLLHGTLLRDLDLDMVESCLLHPPREPDYRGRRSHRGFITSLRALGVELSRTEMEEVIVASARRLVEDGAMAFLPDAPTHS